MVKHPSEFKHQSVRDLAWAISSPPLLSRVSSDCVWPDYQWYRQLYTEALSWLIVVDADPAELDEMLVQQKDKRLGKYFETLWLYWLKHNGRYQVIASNLQIIIDGRTLGEIDFIVFDKTSKRTMHWEMAIKFYLGMGDTREMCNWHGPNLRDRLDIKVQHLLHRQSMISKDKQVKQWLSERGIVIDQCAVILKGRLYYPWQCYHQGGSDPKFLPTVSPASCCDELLYGWWFHESEFDQEFDSEQSFLPLINKGWMERISTDGVKDCCHKSDLFETVSNNLMRYPLQVQLCKPCHSWDRVFIVYEGWGGVES